METPKRFEIPAGSSEFRDWSHLSELPLSEVLRRLVPCIPALAAFAATCRRWRRFLVASATTLLLPRIPPLLLHPDYYSKSNRLHAFSPRMIPEPITSQITAFPSTLLSSSRGHLIFLARPRGVLVLVDAFTGAERLALPLPSPHCPHHYATLTATHLLLFVSKHVFVSLPFPPPDLVPEWTHRRIPSAASFVASVVEFRGRVLGVTDRAQLLDFRLDAGAAPGEEVRMLPTTGLPDATTFESCHFGPRLVAAGERLLLLLLLRTGQEGSGAMGQPSWVSEVGVYALDMAEGVMRWEETDTIGPGYSLFVDYAGRSAVACADAGGCGADGGSIYFSEGWHREGAARYWKSFRPGEGWEEHTQGLQINAWTWTQAWVYPRLFFGS